MTSGTIRAHTLRRAPGTLAGALIVVAVLILSLGAVLALTALRVRGTTTYVTDPVATLVLAGSAIGIAVLARRGSANRARRWLAWIALAVAAYLALGAAATASVASGNGTATLIVGVWGVAWAPPLVLIQLAALDRVGVGRVWRSVLAVSATATLLVSALLTEPEAPFQGLQPAAPEGWSSPALVDVMSALMFVAMLVAPVMLGRRAAVAPTERRRSIAAAVASAVPPLLIVICVGLAIARDPGAVSPSLGSVGYLVCLGVGCLAAGGALAIADAARVDPRALRWMAVGVLAAYAGVAIVLGATVVAAALAPNGSLVAGFAVATLALGVATAWWRGTTAIAALIDAGAEREPARRIPLLSRREDQVLALVAEGARDAAIAQQLHISDRTVEAHLRRIFTKLELEVDDGRNRRLLAARAWLEASQSSVGRD